MSCAASLMTKSSSRQARSKNLGINICSVFLSGWRKLSRCSVQRLALFVDIEDIFHTSLKQHARNSKLFGFARRQKNSTYIRSNVLCCPLMTKTSSRQAQHENFGMKIGSVLFSLWQRKAAEMFSRMSSLVFWCQRHLPYELQTNHMEWASVEFSSEVEENSTYLQSNV